jgi:hypothetical protein
VVLIAAAAWIGITLIVLAICRAATRDDKREDAATTDSAAKPVGLAAGERADAPADRPSSPE